MTTQGPETNYIEETPNLHIKLYPRRWFLLGLFMWFACVVSTHWMQFGSVNNIMARYYNVPGSHIEWTAIMCMAARTFVLFPALFLMDRLDTRNTLILGSTLCVVGAVIKCFSVSPDGFHIALIGQIFAALSVVFTYSIVARFAADWFGSDEISKAGALGCVGDQMGGALGFLLPSLFVPDSPVVEEVEKGIQLMHYVYVAKALVTLILVVLFFKSKPKRPPSAAQIRNRSNKTQGVLKSVKKNLSNTNFMLFTLSHSFLVGSSLNGYGTLLNEMIVTNFPDSTKHAGIIGCINYLSGMTGSIVLSYILDKSRKFKGNAVTLATVNCICLAACAVAMRSGNIAYLYVAYTIFGFFLQAYYATGIQMGIELTFPVPEGITVAMMSVGIELCSMFAASILGVSVRTYGDFKSIMVLTFFIFLSTIIVCLVPAKFRREELERAAKFVELKEFLPDPRKKKYFTALGQD